MHKDVDGRESWRTSLKNVWRQMIARCHRPTHRHYKDYGGRGISVCDDWRDSFELFAEHMGPRPSPEHSIDRVNNDDGYHPGNVRWATRTEQARNKRNSLLLSVGGNLVHAMDAAKEAGVEYKTLHARMSRGWTHERALSEPVKLGRQKDLKHGTLGMYNGRKCRCRECRDCNADYRREHNRKRRTQNGSP